MTEPALAQIQAERALLIARLESSQERLLKMLADVSERSCTVHPREGAWSVRDVVEHLVVVEHSMRERLKNAAPNNAAPDFEKDAWLLTFAVDRSSKREAPEQVRPAGRFSTLAETVAAFKKARQETIAYLRNAPGDLRKVKAQHRLGELDGHQLMLVLALHTERHTLQIDEIKNHSAGRG